MNFFYFITGLFQFRETGQQLEQEVEGKSLGTGKEPQWYVRILVNTTNASLQTQSFNWRLFFSFRFSGCSIAASRRPRGDGRTYGKPFGQQQPHPLTRLRRPLTGRRRNGARTPGRGKWRASPTSGHRSRLPDLQAGNHERFNVKGRQQQKAQQSLTMRLTSG